MGCCNLLPLDTDPVVWEYGNLPMWKEAHYVYEAWDGGRGLESVGPSSWGGVQNESDESSYDDI